MQKNITKSNKIMTKQEFFLQRRESIEQDFKELYQDGKRPKVILEQLAEKHGLSVHSIYRQINIKDLKREVDNSLIS
jgi:hypothetical protein